EVHTLQQLFRIALSVQHKVIQPVGFWHVGLNREDGEAFLGSQKLDHAMLQLKELACTVCSFAERDNARIAHYFLERLHVLETMLRLDGIEGNCMFPRPVDKRLIGGSRAGWSCSSEGSLGRCC